MNDMATPTDSRVPAVAQHAHAYAATDGADGHIWHGVPTLLLTTTGRRSGAARRTVLIYGRHEGLLLLAASHRGAAHHPDWYLNLQSNPLVTVQIRGERLPARARTLAGPAREQAWTTMAQLYPEYVRYQAQTSRIIPVVALEPIGPATPEATTPTPSGSPHAQT
ncbi:nitroreductase family deazaflavin-dependent oxidoreductase [Catenuloplanes japonicus]|uniref:nitroreductase family deazaflavin-dependent oxidoreductase n=1 Tax=Catenuloplanes japonicus TaxID=33876 RepID=UPI0007C4F527|nr:nitroreductase family deazaflavin-dependent oxidoreductase [Catenuloplanes japonicus]